MNEYSEEIFEDSDYDIASDEDWDEADFETVIVENQYDTVSDDEDMKLDIKCYNVLGTKLAPPSVNEVAPTFSWPRVAQPSGTGLEEREILVPERRRDGR